MVALVTQCCWDAQVLWAQSLEIKHNLCCTVWIFLLLKTTPSLCDPVFYHSFAYECISSVPNLRKRLEELTNPKWHTEQSFQPELARYAPLYDLCVKHIKSKDIWTPCLWPWPFKITVYAPVNTTSWYLLHLLTPKCIPRLGPWGTRCIDVTAFEKKCFKGRKY